MTLKETQDKEDILIIMMLKERDKQIETLEIENASLKKLLIDTISENNHLLKTVREFKFKRYGGTKD